MTGFHVQTRSRYPLGSVTPAGAVREWRIVRCVYWGHGVPKMASVGWLEPVTVSASGPTVVSQWHTERHALNVLNSLDRECVRLAVLSSREARARTGETFTHPRTIGFYRSVDQSCAVGGSRSGQSPMWHRLTLLTETRDGVKYTEDITIERNPFGSLQ